MKPGVVGVVCAAHISASAAVRNVSRMLSRGCEEILFRPLSVTKAPHFRADDTTMDRDEVRVSAGCTAAMRAVVCMGVMLFAR